MFELKVLTRFAAAHQLKMVGDKCENLHGHNWRIEVRICGEKLNAAGVVMDFGVIKGHLKEIIRQIDHTFLNEHADFPLGVSPSSENIAFLIARKLGKRITEPGVFLKSVSAWESDDACATYICP